MAEPAAVSGDDALRQAATELEDALWRQEVEPRSTVTAQQRVHVARRKLRQALLAAPVGGEPCAQCDDWQQKLFEQIRAGDDMAQRVRFAFGIEPDGRSLEEQLLALRPATPREEAETAAYQEGYAEGCKRQYGQREAHAIGYTAGEAAAFEEAAKIADKGCGGMAMCGGKEMIPRESVKEVVDFAFALLAQSFRARAAERRGMR